MSILRLFFVALVIAMAFFQINDAKPEPNVKCICDNGDTGDEWFGGCHPDLAEECGKTAKEYTFCCKKFFFNIEEA